MIAKKLEEEEYWTKCLNEEEHAILQENLGSAEKWNKFFQNPSNNGTKMKMILVCWTLVYSKWSSDFMINFKIRKVLFDVLNNMTIFNPSLKDSWNLSRLGESYILSSGLMKFIANMSQYVTLEDDLEDFQREMASIAKAKLV